MSGSKQVPPTSDWLRGGKKACLSFDVLNIAPRFLQHQYKQ